jgi:ribosomal protein S27E
MPRCPGQDQRFWKPDDIFEVECPVCEFSVEFWKDEPQVKCPSCKQLIVNPKLDLGCAKWCKHAEECLGQIAGQEKSNLSTRLIESLLNLSGKLRRRIRVLFVLHWKFYVMLKRSNWKKGENHLLSKRRQFYLTFMKCQLNQS